MAEHCLLGLGRLTRALGVPVAEGFVAGPAGPAFGPEPLPGEILGGPLHFPPPLGERVEPRLEFGGGRACGVTEFGARGNPEQVLPGAPHLPRRAVVHRLRPVPQGVAREEPPVLEPEVHGEEGLRPRAGREREEQGHRGVGRAKARHPPAHEPQR